MGFPAALMACTDCKRIMFANFVDVPPSSVICADCSTRRGWLRHCQCWCSKCMSPPHTHDCDDDRCSMTKRRAESGHVQGTDEER